MAQIAPLSINNGAATPVAISFVVESGQQGQTSPATWYGKLSSAVNGWLKLTAMKRKTPGSKATKVVFKTEMPKMAVMGVAADGSTPAPTRVSTGYVETTYTVPDNFEDLDRANMYAFHTGFLTDVQARAMVKNLETSY